MTGKMRQMAIVGLQVCLLFMVSRLGEILTARFRLPLPGSIVGMFILFGLLKLGIVRLEWVGRGGDWLLSDLLLFIIPAAVGVMQYLDLLAHGGLVLLAVIGASTVAVMLASGGSAEAMSRVLHHADGGGRA